MQQETSGGNYSQVDFHYDGQGGSSTASAVGATSPTAAESSSTPAEESELPYTLPNNLLVAPAPDIQLVTANAVRQPAVSDTKMYVFSLCSRRQ